ncbi:MAG TPA: C39 family peptidase [Candidatus Dormibacteraeota bacterium]
MRTSPPGWRRGRRLLAIATVLAAMTSLRPDPGLAATAPVAPVAAVHGGAVLDGFGGLHPFGGLALNTSGSTYWNGWDIARSLALRADGSGGWVLDGFGGIHPFGAAAPVSGAPYWSGWDIARAVVVTSTDAAGVADGRQGYVLDGFGGVHPWGGAPVIGAPPYTAGQDRARGLEIHHDALGVPDGGWVLDAAGTVHAFGAAPPPAAAPSPAAPVWQALHASGAALYAVPRWGVVSTLGPGISPFWDGYADWGSWDILRDLVLVGAPNPLTVAQPVSSAASATLGWASRSHGGATLDGYGGLHPFGGLPLDTTGAPYWRGWDIARSLALRDDGSGGWVLDGYGGVHAFGRAGPVSAPAYWGGWDIARALVVTSRGADGLADGRQGYVLDGYGGLHPWGGAPNLTSSVYWSGWDVARGLEIHLDAGGRPDGGWVLDAFGGIHPFGAAPALASPADYLSGRDLALKLHLAGGTAYVVRRFGGISAPASLAPSWGGYTDWGAWDILRDTVLINPGDPRPVPQPVSPAAAVAYRTQADRYTMWVPAVQQAYALDCEAAALTAALAARGVTVTQEWVLAQIGADSRQPQLDASRRILRWGNPNLTFVGDVNGSEPRDTGYGVYQAPIAAAARAAGRPAIGARGWDPWALLDEVARGHPAVIWVDTTFTPVTMHQWTAWDGSTVDYSIGEHAVTVVGVDAVAGTMTLLDVAHAQLRTFTIAQFVGFFASFGNMAVVVS